MRCFLMPSGSLPSNWNHLPTPPHPTPSCTQTTLPPAYKLTVPAHALALRDFFHGPGVPGVTMPRASSPRCSYA